MSPSIPDPWALPARCRGASDARAGHAAVAGLLWLIALSLFVLPFLRDPLRPDWGVKDPTRNPEVDIPFAEDVAEFDRYAAEEELGLEGSLSELIARESQARFGFESESFRDSGLVDFVRLGPGRRDYEVLCAGCHGLEGDGAGPGARVMHPRPRNFRKGIYKFTSTETGEPPLRRDLFRTVTAGMPGASMPNFRLLSEERRKDVVEYVVYLSIRGEFEQKMLDLAWSEEELPDPEEVAEIVMERWTPGRAKPVYPTAAEPPFDDASIARGRELFLDPETASCFSCHGELGRGDGPSATAFEDVWGYPIRPRDFRAGVFRRADEPADIWITVATGIGGTQMGQFLGALSGEDIWHLVHYVQYLAADQQGD